jgi:hypothetical protein
VSFWFRHLCVLGRIPGVDLLGGRVCFRKCLGVMAEGKSLPLPGIKPSPQPANSLTGSSRFVMKSTTSITWHIATLPFFLGGGGGGILFVCLSRHQKLLAQCLLAVDRIHVMIIKIFV